ncbi:conserved hypothetical protein [Vibrio owensii]|uniref:Ig-like domain-containing protein n=1 Tax=Vibrio owensii TaxID=696485 RepID=UPI002893AFAF|nr:conserved hypothetical protein [Vibrio owensii]CAH1550852.1 conserved hypothetical protein [Vibrio owensii]
MKFKLLFISTLLLSGCNGGSSSSDSISVDAPEALHIETSPIQSKGLVSEEVAIDVLATNDVNAVMKVTSVRSISGDSCQVTSIDEQSFTANSDEVGECQYEYTVVPQNSELYVGEESSIVRVSVSETAADNTLPNLAETTDIDTPVVIDLAQELAEELDTSVFYLSSDASVLGAGFVDSNTANNMLTFTPFDVGVSRITYSMTDGSVTKLGTIDVAVSDTQNTPPVALNYVREGKLDKGMLVTIDLTDYVSDAEDAVILESVRAYNAETEITSASEHTFTFRSSEPGAHEIAYTVNDGRGGYDVGQVYIEVEPDFSLVQDWEDVVVYDPTIDAEITFIAPASKVLADYTNTPYTGYRTQDGTSGPKNAEVVTMNLEQAQNYCATRNGRLPISREWALLNGSQGDLFSTQNWPAGTDFWSADMLSEATGKSVNATNGATSELPKESGEGFVTCVLLDSESVKDFSTRIDSESNSEALLEHYLSFQVSDPDGNLAPFQNLEAQVGHAKGVFSNGLSKITLVTDSSGGSSETYRDTSLNNAVLSTVVSSNSEDATVIKSATDEMYIDTTDSSIWNIAEVLGGYDFRTIDEQGIPLHYKTNTKYEIAAVYKSSFIGRDFVARYRLKANDVPSINNGKLNFVLQQVSNSPNKTNWGYQNAYQEGLPHSTAVISNEINYYSQNITTILGNYYLGGVESKFNSLPTRYEYWYVWFVIQDDSLLVYTSTSDDRPEEPTSVLENVWRTIDPSQPYWIGFGGAPGAGAAESVSIYANALWAGSGS